MSYQNNHSLKESYPHLEQLFEKDKLQKPIKDITVLLFRKNWNNLLF